MIYGIWQWNTSQYTLLSIKGDPYYFVTDKLLNCSDMQREFFLKKVLSKQWVSFQSPPKSVFCRLTKPLSEKAMICHHTDKKNQRQTNAACFRKWIISAVWDDPVTFLTRALGGPERGKHQQGVHLFTALLPSARPSPRRSKQRGETGDVCLRHHAEGHVDSVDKIKCWLAPTHSQCYNELCVCRSPSVCVCVCVYFWSCVCSKCVR